MVKNTKIFVNWQAKRIVHAKTSVGSAVYKNLRSRGYVEVGVAKPNEEFFWKAQYFDPDSKYEDEPQIEKIQTPVERIRRRHDPNKPYVGDWD